MAAASPSRPARRRRRHGGAAALAVALAAAAALPAAARAAQCSQVGCDARFSSVAYGALADDHVAPVVEGVVLAAAPGDSIAHPVLLTGDATALAVAVAVSGNITVWGRDSGGGGPSAWWAPPPSAGAVVAVQAVVAAEPPGRPARLVVALQRHAAPSVELWGLDAGPGPVVRVAWGPAALPGGPSAAQGPLMAAGGWVLTAGPGGLFAVDPASGNASVALEPVYFTCGGQPDAPAGASAPVLLQSQPLAVGVVTSRGCALGATLGAPGGGLPPGATVAWRVDRPVVLPPASAMGAPPAADATLLQLYAATLDGWVCCYTAALGPTGGSACWGWGGARCVSLSAAAPAGVNATMPPGAGLAVSPADSTFHGGAVYAVDAGGWVYAVGSTSGAVAVTLAPVVRAPAAAGEAPLPGAPPPAPRPAPLLVPGGFGPTWNALLVVTPAGGVHALSVGDVGTSSDDDDYNEGDDDGAVSTGTVWTLPLPAGGARVAVPYLSLTPAGRLLVPVGGRVFVVGSPRGDPLVDLPELPAVTLAACLGATALGLAAAVALGQRARAGAAGRALQARALIRAAFIAELGRLEGEGGGGEWEGEGEGGGEGDGSAKRGWGGWAGGRGGAASLAESPGPSSAGTGAWDEPLSERLLPGR